MCSTLIRSIFPGRETLSEVKLDSWAPHVVSAGVDGIILRDRADGRNHSDWSERHRFLNCESRVQAKDVVRGSRRRKAMKTSLVRRIEIGAMLCGHWYNTNRMAVWPDRSRLIHVRQETAAQQSDPLPQRRNSYRKSVEIFSRPEIIV